MTDTKHTSQVTGKPAKKDDSDPNSISIQAAKEIIAARLLKITDKESVAMDTAYGRILACDVDSPINVPSFRASAMDGYAYRHAERENKLQISAQSLAGHPSEDHANANECHRITTGARVPDFADTVVQQENVSVNNNTITINQHSDISHHVRAAGSDSTKGASLMQRGQRLAAAQIATLTSHGFTEVEVIRPIKIAVFSTGDELAKPQDKLQRGHIYDANRALISGILKSPAVDINDLGIVKDTPEALQEVFTLSMDADVVISSGGVSVGDADFVRPVLEQMGELHMWKIAMKPGRPLTFGNLAKNNAYFGLPGNPVSAAITCMVFVLPALQLLTGQPVKELPRIKATLKTTLTKMPGRVEYQRGVLTLEENGLWSVSTTGIQDSHVVTSLHHANCFVELAYESAGAQASEEVMVIPFAHFSESLL